MTNNNDREYVDVGVFRERTEHLSEKIDGISDKIEALDAYLRNGLSNDVVKNSTWLKMILWVHSTILATLFSGVVYAIFRN